MSRDCVDSSFSVRLLQERQNGSRDEEGAAPERIMSVVVKVDRTKVKLSWSRERFRARVGRQPVLLPFIRLGVLTALVTRSTVQVRTHLGIKVVWDGKHSLRITMPSKMRGRVCGLCGNFNGEADDDDRSRKGIRIRDPERLLASWKAGKSCAGDHSPTGSAGSRSGRRHDACAGDWKKRITAMTACNRLKAAAFTSCHRTVAISPFYK